VNFDRNGSGFIRTTNHLERQELASMIEALLQHKFSDRDDEKFLVRLSICKWSET
jgi:hypothetical protein